MTDTSIIITVKGLSISTNPLTARFCTCFWTSVIRGQSVTQGSMGRSAPRYPPWGPEL